VVLARHVGHVGCDPHLQRRGTLDDQLGACLTELHAQAAPVLRRSLAAEPLPPDGLAQPGTFRAPGGWAPFGSP
jgi:hypothetical protein